MPETVPVDVRIGVWTQQPLRLYPRDSAMALLVSFEFKKSLEVVWSLWHFMLNE